MTPRISLVAVCCSSDSLSSWNSRTILDRDHGLVGEGLEELDLHRGERADLGATCVQHTNEFPLLTKGNN